MATQIRLAVAADFTPIAALTNSFIQDTAVHFGSEPVTADDLAAASGQQVLGVTYPWLVASRDGAFCGYAKASAWRARAAYAWSTETTIYLTPPARGQGLGRALYRRLLDVLRAQGFRSAIGGITLPNDASVQLHEALGFEPCGVIRDAGCKFGRWHDVGFWQLRLAADTAPGAALRPLAEAWTAGTLPR